MPNLKDIRRRIRSVKSTQKITQAMRMVAAAKVKRAENRVKAARPYAETLLSVFGQVVTGMNGQFPSAEGVFSLLQPRASVKTVALVVVTSDRGLCGAYNASILRQASRMVREYAQQGLTIKLYLVGNKAIQAFKRDHQGSLLGQRTNCTVAPTVEDARAIVQTLTEAYQRGDVDRVDILSTVFKSMVSYPTQVTQLLPLSGQPGTEKIETSAPKAVQPEWLLEPNPTAVLEPLVPMVLTQTVYQLLLEASASELAARMTAMTNATKNAGEMIQKLTLAYNKARQAAITQEILEIVSGAQALA